MIVYCSQDEKDSRGGPEIALWLSKPKRKDTDGNWEGEGVLCDEGDSLPIMAKFIRAMFPKGVKPGEYVRCNVPRFVAIPKAQKGKK